MPVDERPARTRRCKQCRSTGAGVEEIIILASCEQCCASIERRRGLGWTMFERLGVSFGKELIARRYRVARKNPLTPQAFMVAQVRDDILDAIMSGATLEEIVTECKRQDLIGADVDVAFVRSVLPRNVFKRRRELSTEQIVKDTIAELKRLAAGQPALLLERRRYIR